jgi:hypothetical protein
MQYHTNANIFSALTRKQADALFDMMISASNKCSDASERLCGLEAWAGDKKVNDMWRDQNAILAELNSNLRFR